MNNDASLDQLFHGIEPTERQIIITIANASPYALPEVVELFRAVPSVQDVLNVVRQANALGLSLDLILDQVRGQDGHPGTEPAELSLAMKVKDGRLYLELNRAVQYLVFDRAGALDLSRQLRAGVEEMEQTNGAGSYPNEYPTPTQFARLDALAADCNLNREGLMNLVNLAVSERHNGEGFLHPLGVTARWRRGTLRLSFEGRKAVLFPTPYALLRFLAGPDSPAPSALNTAPFLN